MSSNINQRVLTALKEAKEKLAAIEQQREESIAIIGMAGRFPGANNLDEYWHNLQQGINSIKFLTKEELLESGVAPDLIAKPNYVRAYSGFDDIEYFAADFFGYSPKEAEIIDPQHRIFLESAWTALENAGYDGDRYEGKIGVFAGSSLNTYLINLHSSTESFQKLNDVQVFISNAMGLMPTRVSYKLNLKGASYGVQTACSTSLVSVHLACQSLLSGESDMALAGGIAVHAEGKQGYLYQEGGIASPDGYCRAFDTEGKGTVFGNGVGIVVLKRLSDAVRDKDNIWAVIKGSAINNDGADKVGLTAPSVAGQAEVIDRALKQAQIKPETISYIEAHGTGTSLGDPIEIAALNKVFAHGKYQQNSCGIGSVKTNLGHLDVAAGIAGLIKTVLALNHQQIPPSLNFQHPNTEIDFANSPFYVNTQLTNWEKNGNPRRAGVSSFGMGGTNAHIVLEESQVGANGRSPVPESAESAQNYLLVISAKTETALDRATVNLANYLEKNPDLDLADVAYTLQIGRKAFDYRRAVVCQDTKEAIEKLTSSTTTQTQTAIDRPITFMFSGQGSQYMDMGRNLYQNEPVFKENCDRCFQILEQYLDTPLQEIIFSPNSSNGVSPNAPTPKINQTQYAQPAIFIIEYSLAQLWISWGIKPANAIGHSIGEYVAATLAGVFSLEDALRIVAKRGQLMQQCPKGAMLSVAMSANDIASVIGKLPDLSLAVINAPELCVVSGTEKAIAELETQLPQQGIACRRLHTSHGFHSAMMEEILSEFTAELSVGVNGHSPLQSPQLPFISNVTGTWITKEEATNPAYWAKHIRETVRFSPGISEILQQPNQILLEIGGGRTLATLAKQHQRESAGNTLLLTSLRHPKEEIADTEFMLNTLGKLWLAGVDLDWESFYQDQIRYRLPLPTYPFERKRYWIDRASNTSNNTKIKSEAKPLKQTKKPDIQDWFYIPSWQRIQPLSHSKIDIQATQTCLVFANPDSFSTEFTTKLQALNGDVTTVTIAEQFTKTGDRSYSINPHNPDDYVALIDNLREQARLPKKIIYLWGLSSTVVKTSESPLKEFNSLIYLVQALTSEHLTTPIQLSLITNDIQEVTGTETLNPYKAMILGACKVIPQEYPPIICHNIDLELDSLNNSRVLDSLIADILTIPQENAIAYRNNYRWQQVISPLPLTKCQSLPLKQQGTYLIAGDLVEGLGMMYAQYLAQDYQAKLVLVGRKGLPSQENWEEWLETTPKHSAKDCIHQLKTLTQSGTEILFISADLTDELAIKSLVAEANQRFGQIDGVIHSGTAGDNYSCSLPSLTESEIDKQFQTKVRGLVNLSNIFADVQLDFFLLQSSLSSVVGGVSFAAYTAANIFMDTFATVKNSEGKTPWFSINWDGYDNHPSSVNSQQSLTATSSPVSNTGLALIDLAINTKEAWEITQKVFASGINQIIVSPTDLQPRIDQWIKPKSLLEIDKLQAITSLNALANNIRPNVNAEYVAPQNEIEASAVKIMEELLGITPIGIDDNFFELGGHSLLAIQVVAHLKEEFNVDIPLREFLFESPSAKKIAQVISNNSESNTDIDEIERLLDRVENLSAEEIQVIDISRN